MDPEVKNQLKTLMNSFKLGCITTFLVQWIRILSEDSVLSYITIFVRL